MSDTVRLLAPSDVSEVAALLARSMDQDPAYRFLFPDPAERAPGLARLFARNLDVHLPHRCAHVLVRGGELLGTVTLRPPAGVPISALTMLRHGLAPFAQAHGLRAVGRLLRLKRTYDALEAELARDRPHWHVHMMAVRAGEQGRGNGSRLIREVLRSAVDAPIVLTTHTEANVTFYRRQGFEVDAVRTLGPPFPDVRVWCMRRGVSCAAG